MSFHQVSNIVIKGISTCIPRKKKLISDLELLNAQESIKFTKNTGIISRNEAEDSICASDLCFEAAKSILEKLNWNRNDVDVLIFVTQTPDYILPATSNLLQNRLGLSNDCFCLDVSLGCSGYVYGMSLISNLLQNPSFKKGLLLVGDTITKLTSPKDKSVFPLFGDAGTATALEFDSLKPTKISFLTGVDGSGENAIKITHGAGRNKIENKSFEFRKSDDQTENERRDVDLKLNGLDVFNFAIKTVPKTIDQLLNDIKLDRDEIDCYVFHQANLFMNETIRKKLKLASDKCINSIEDFGNTNGASIPLTLCVNYKEFIPTGNFIMCGFGVGLSWGAFHYTNEQEILLNISYL
jgi:3-oxoacyl-[acyl-carrier-protein] synthase-3